MTVYDLAAIAQRSTDSDARAALEWADSYIMGLLAERAQLIETLHQRTAERDETKAALQKLERAVNESVSGLRVVRVDEWSALLAQAQRALLADEGRDGDGN